jgi:hypothetical protein
VYNPYFRLTVDEMAQQYGPNKNKPGRGRGRARRYDGFEDRDLDGG